MLIIPAIDIKDGQCVRLKQGVMDDATVFSENPEDMARHWLEQGARRLHLVDLNGAFAGKPKNEALDQRALVAKPTDQRGRRALDLGNDQRKSETRISDIGDHIGHYPVYIIVLKGTRSTDAIVYRLG